MNVSSMAVYSYGLRGVAVNMARTKPQLSARCDIFLSYVVQGRRASLTSGRRIGLKRLSRTPSLPSYRCTESGIPGFT